MAHALVDPTTGRPLATAALISSAKPPPLELPHLVVSTPGALVSMMDNVGPAFGYEWTRAGALKAVGAGTRGNFAGGRAHLASALPTPGSMGPL